MRLLDRLLVGLGIVALLILGVPTLSSHQPPLQIGASIVVGRVTPHAGRATAGVTPAAPVPPAAGSARARGCSPAATPQPGSVGAPFEAAPAPPAAPLQAGNRGWHLGKLAGKPVGKSGGVATKHSKGAKATGKKPSTAAAHGKYSKQGRAAIGPSSPAHRF